MSNDDTHPKPTFFEFLTVVDQGRYLELQNRVASPENRYNRNKRLATFQDILDDIRQFCEFGDPNEWWKRYLVCGVCWINKDIAINTRQLRVLIAKSKSSINGALAKMGYETIPFKAIDSCIILQAIPFLRGHGTEMRQWTLRKRTFSYNQHQSPNPVRYLEVDHPYTEQPSFFAQDLDNELLQTTSFDWSIPKPPQTTYTSNTSAYEFHDEELYGFENEEMSHENDDYSMSTWNEYESFAF